MFIVFSVQEAGVTPSNFGPGLIFGPFTAPESMTGATASQVFPDLATAAEERYNRGFHAGYSFELYDPNTEF